MVVDVADFGLSYQRHRLFNWTIDLRRPPPTYVTSKRRQYGHWHNFHVVGFGRNQVACAICDRSLYVRLAVDDLAVLYGITIKYLLDRHALLRCLIARQCPSSIWFDDDCHVAKWRRLRCLERAVRRLSQLSDTILPAAVQRRAEHRRYVDLLHLKQSSFWTARIIGSGGHLIVCLIVAALMP
jgi:hypothetical protein